MIKSEKELEEYIASYKERHFSHVSFCMRLSEDQQKKINHAIELLDKYDHEKCELNNRTYFTAGEDGDAYDDFETCGNKKCIASAKRALRKSLKLPKYARANIYLQWDNRMGDNDKIDHCYSCGCKMTGSLTWIKEELWHHENYSTTREVLVSSSVAYDVKVMFEAMPSHDYSIEGYPKYQYQLGNRKPLIDSVNHQLEFVDRVMKYAGLVISELNKTDK